MSEQLIETANRLTDVDRELAALNAHCQALQTWLCRRLACGNCDRAALLRYFGDLSLATARISTILVQRADAGGANQLEEFLAVVAECVWDKARNEAEAEDKAKAEARARSQSQAEPCDFGGPFPPPLPARTLPPFDR